MDESKNKLLRCVQRYKWEPIVERHICIFFKSLIFEGEFLEVYKEVFLGEDVFPVGDVSYKDFLFCPKEFLLSVENTAKKIVAKHGFIKLIEISEGCQQAASHLHDFLKNGLSDDLIKDMKNFRKLYAQLAGYLLSIYFCENYLDEQIKSLIKRKCKSFDEQYYQDLVYIRKDLESDNEKKDWLKLVKLVQKTNVESKLNEQIDNHINNYSWLSVRWNFENPWTKKDLLDRLKTNKKEENAVVNLSPRVLAEQKTQGFITKYNLIEEEIALISVVKEFVFLRSFRTESLYKAHYLVKELIEKAASKIDLTLEEIKYLTISEVIGCVEGREVDKNKITERQESNVLIVCNNQLGCFSGEDFEKIEETGLFKLNAFEEEIKGQCAYSGKVKGKVKIVVNNHDIKKVNPGDIIVTIMTTPNLIPAMEKAAAFITDEGGILCHAAIVSREMRKPCIIGTKNATKVLKDNDFVEVDANHGIVRKISNYAQPTRK